MAGHRPPPQDLECTECGEIYDSTDPAGHECPYERGDLDEDREVLRRSGATTGGDVRHLELVARKIAAGWQEGYPVDGVAASLPDVGTVTWGDLAALTVSRQTTRGAVPERYVREVFEAAWLLDHDRFIDNPEGSMRDIRRNPRRNGDANGPTRTEVRSPTSTSTEVRSPTSTSTEVRSPTSTSTEVRSPTNTSTSTEAYTADNVTVTGGAGAGATTSVTIYSSARPVAGRPHDRDARGRSGGQYRVPDPNFDVNRDRAPRPEFNVDTPRAPHPQFDVDAARTPPVRNPPVEFIKQKVDRGWPETWEAKIGQDYYTVSARRGSGWRVQYSHRPKDVDGSDLGGTYPTREEAMAAAANYAAYASRPVGNPAPGTHDADFFDGRCAGCGGKGRHQPQGRHRFESTEGMKLFLVGIGDDLVTRYAVAVDPGAGYDAHSRALERAMPLKIPGRKDTWYVWAPDVATARRDSDGGFGEYSFVYPTPTANPASDFKDRCGICGGLIADHTMTGGYHKPMRTTGMKLFIVGTDDARDVYAVEVYDEQSYEDHVRELDEAMQLDKPGTYKTWYVWDTDDEGAARNRKGMFMGRTFRYPLVEATENPQAFLEWPHNYNAGRAQRNVGETWHMVPVATRFKSPATAICGKTCREVLDPETVANSNGGINVCSRCAGIFGQRS